MKQGWKCLAALKCQQKQGLYICLLSFSQCVMLYVIYLLWMCLPNTGETRGTENQILYLITFSIFSQTRRQGFKNTE